MNGASKHPDMSKVPALLDHLRKALADVQIEARVFERLASATHESGESRALYGIAMELAKLENILAEAIAGIEGV